MNRVKFSQRVKFSTRLFSTVRLKIKDFHRVKFSDEKTAKVFVFNELRFGGRFAVGSTRLGKTGLVCL